MFLLPVIVKETFHLIVDLLLVLCTREKNADAVNIVLQVCSLVVHDKDNPVLRPKEVLFEFSPHVPFPLLLCRSGIFVLVAKDAHNKFPVVSISCSTWLKGVARSPKVNYGIFISWQKMPGPEKVLLFSG
jgi:hypothetical protein